MVDLARRLFTVEDFHKLAEAGFIDPDERLELIDGEIIAMSPIGSRHAACVDRLTRRLMLTLQHSAAVRVQGPLLLHTRSELYPEVLVLRAREHDYADQSPLHRGDTPAPLAFDSVRIAVSDVLG